MSERRNDLVANVVAQWREVEPDLDLSPIEVMARINRLGTLLAGADAHLRGTGLSRPEFDLLGTLRRVGRPLTAGELARDTTASNAAITKRLKVLEGRGLIERAADPRDGRVVLVRLTAAGQELHARHFADQLDSDWVLLADLGPDEREVLADLLARVLAHADNAAPRR